MRPDLEGGNPVRLDIRTAKRLQHGVQPMATGVEFVTDRADLPVFARAFDLVCLRVMRLSEPQRSGKPVLGRGHARLCPKSGLNASAGGKTGVQRLCHRAELCLDPRCHRGAQPQRMPRLVFIQPQQPRSSKRGTEGPGRRRLVVADLVMCPPQPDTCQNRGLNPHSRRINRIREWGIKGLGQRHNRREHRYGRMADVGKVGVVIIKGMAQRAIDQGRRRRPKCPASKHLHGPFLDHLGTAKGVKFRLLRACNATSRPIKHRQAHHRRCLLWHLDGRKFNKLFGNSHGVLP